MKLGIVGTSWISDKFVAAARMADMEVAAVYSRRSETGAEFAVKHGIPKVYTDLGKLLAEGGVDAVYLASPNALHLGQALEAVRAGKHVFVEKPAFVNERQVSEVLKAAKKAGVLVLECVRSYYNPMMETIRKALPQIGKVRYAYFNHMKYSSKYDAYLAGQEPTVFSPEYAGGANMDLGVYSIYACLYLFGEPQADVCSSVLLDNGADGVCTQILNYGGFLCTLSSGKVSTTALESEIQGEEGTIVIDHIAELRRVTLLKNGEEQLLGEAHLENDLYYEAKAFREMIERQDQTAYEAACGRMLACVRLLEHGRAQSGMAYPADFS